MVIKNGLTYHRERREQAEASCTPPSAVYAFSIIRLSSDDAITSAAMNVKSENVENRWQDRVGAATEVNPKSDYLQS